MSKYDLLVIGGGINGLGIAADAAQRGLSVLIVEKSDWGGGTTSASSRLIHGGLRYLQYGEVDLVRESLRERGILARQRPHLVHPIQLLIPSYKGAPTPRWMVGAGLVMYDVLARDPLFPRPSILSAQKARAREPGLNPDGLMGGYIYPDAQIEFPERICVELVLEMRAAGGEARSHTRVTGLRQEQDRVVGATLRDELSGQIDTVDAALVINATGPWLDVINKTLAAPPPKLIGGTWGTHLVLPARAQGPAGPLYATAQKDGRPFFLLPWDNRLLVGTTDVKFEGDPDDLSVQPWEIEYLLRETNHLFPGCRYVEDDIEVSTVGVRPLPASDKNAGAVSRRHFLVDHGEKHGIAGLASIVGGKLTTYRSLAEHVVDWSLRALNRPPVPCLTGKIMPVKSVNEQIADACLALRRVGLAQTSAPRLVGLYGPRTGEVIKRVEANPILGVALEGAHPATTAPFAAEVVHAVLAEDARTSDDIVSRRLMQFPATEAVRGATLRVCRQHHLPLA